MKNDQHQKEIEIMIGEALDKDLEKLKSETGNYEDINL